MPTMQLRDGHTALVVVDMQRYYVEHDSPFQSYFRKRHPGAMDYISTRCDELVTPHIQQLLELWRTANQPVLFLRLCGTQPDRSDLHPHFRGSYEKALSRGFPDTYPLRSDPYSLVIPALQPLEHEMSFCKTTYSGFTTGDLGQYLLSSSIQTLVFTGLATSQCVETTARDASDRGYKVVHVADAQADYEEVTHRASLYSSQAVCGGEIYHTEQLLRVPLPS